MQMILKAPENNLILQNKRHLNTGNSFFPTFNHLTL